MSLCTVCFKLFKLEGGVLQYIFLVIFPLLVSSKLDSYDEYAPTWGGVLEELGFESLGFLGLFSFYGISLILYNRMLILG